MASLADLTGTDLGQYRILRRIGRGGMGAVYEATHRRIGKRVALKVLHAEHAEDPDTLQRFLNEARAVNEIGHDNIVDIADMGDDGQGTVFLVMELLEGETLRVAVADARLSPERAVGIAAQVCDALAATHAVGIVHRDLKPENVFLRWRLGRPDFVTLVDFGIAKLAHGADLKTRTGTMIGTPQYMSPEQTEGGQGVDGRTDIYALGVMLYEMLSGKLPFQGETVPIILKKIWMDAPVPVADLRPDLPPGLADTVMKAFARDPTGRPQTVQALKAALLACVPEALIVAAWKAMVEAAPQRAASRSAEGIAAATADTFRSGERTPATGAAWMPTLPSEPGTPSPAARAAASAALIETGTRGTRKNLWLAAVLVGGVGLGVAGTAAVILGGGADAGEEAARAPNTILLRTPVAGTTAAPDPAALAATVPGAEGASVAGGAAAPGAGAVPPSAPGAATGAGLGAATVPGAPPVPGAVASLPGAGAGARAAPATGSTTRGEPRIPLDPAVLRSYLLKREGKRLSRCFEEHEGMWEARFALEVNASGRVESVDFTYLGASDGEHQKVLRECLEPLLAAARFPPLDTPGRADLWLAKDDMIARPLHLDLPKLNPVAMEEIVRLKNRAAFDPCFEKHPEIVFVGFRVRLDADGAVIESERSGSSGPDPEGFAACVTPILKAIAFPKTRAGGRFSVDLRKKAPEGS